MQESNSDNSSQQGPAVSPTQTESATQQVNWDISMHMHMYALHRMMSCRTPTFLKFLRFLKFLNVVKPPLKVKLFCRGQYYHTKGPSIGRKRKRCGCCDGCSASDCGKCCFCLDKKKFGGKGTLKQCCFLRRCKRLKLGVSHSCNRSFCSYTLDLYPR